jgi:carbamoyl-phosphate synthase small subunit
VAVWDFGVKPSLVDELVKRGCCVTCVPAFAKAGDVRALSPAAVLLSDGPGDPRDYPEIVREIAALCEDQIPTLGIGLGHQFLALARGAKVTKLRYGHRGANQAVVYRDNTRAYITGQNHGYAVTASTLPGAATEIFINLNDDTCEGVRYDDIPACGVQFQPDTHPGPQDMSFVYNKWLDLAARRQK